MNICNNFFYILISIFLFANPLNGQLIELSEEIEKLQKISDNKQSKINSLRAEINDLFNENSAKESEIKKLDQKIIAKTTKILTLEREMEDIVNKYERMEGEIEALATNSEEKNKIIKQLDNAKNELEDELETLHTNIESTKDSLVLMEHENNLIKSQKKTLENRLNKINDKKRFARFVSMHAITSGGVSLNGNVGKFHFGKALFTGLDLGYKNYNKDPDDFNSNTYKLSLVSGSAKVRYSIIRRDLGFEYIDPSTPFCERAKLYVGLDFGWAQGFWATSDSDYNRGGFTFGGEVGGIISIFESLNTFIFIGYEGQNLRINSINIDGNRERNSTTVNSARFGFGVSF